MSIEFVHNRHTLYVNFLKIILAILYKSKGNGISALFIAVVKLLRLCIFPPYVGENTRIMLHEATKTAYSHSPTKVNIDNIMILTYN